MKVVYDALEAKRLSLITKEPIILVRDKYAYSYKKGKISVSGEIPKNLLFLLKK